ncbi:MAG: glyoxylase-like metal-dependent hydrolase (beta-lactamase superfamily II) [Acidimicrobiales bacterium]|jgi:glyoxylase-like metal-dependent hydrolase (beta-lactamase superfamily II)
MREERRPPEKDVKEVAPGIVRIQLPMNMPGLGHVNCYAIEDKQGLALIDPGVPSLRSWKVLNDQLKSVGLPMKRVHTVVVTHSHPDHYGAAQRIRDLTGAEIVTEANFKTYWDPHEEDEFVREVAVEADYDIQINAIEDALMKITKRTRDSPWDRPVPWGGPPPDNQWKERFRWRILPLLLSKVWQPPKPSKRVVDGEMLMLGDREWVSVHTPGHTADHLCLLDPTEGTFVSGDHLLPTITPHISGLTTQNRPLGDFFDSLERMHTFSDVKTVLPAHGLEFGDLWGRSTEIIDHHLERLDMLVSSGSKAPEQELTVPEYSKHLFKERSWGPMADSETFAHLEHLRQNGRATTRAVEGELRYRIVD